MEVSYWALTAIPMEMYALGFGLGLLVVSFFIKSPIIFIAIILCMVGIMISSEDMDWVKLAAFVMAVWSVIAMIKFGISGRTVR